MSATGYAAFDTTLEKTNGIPKHASTVEHHAHDLTQADDWPKERRNQSYNALRAVLHAARDRLTVEEAAQLSAQLPTLALTPTGHRGARPRRGS